MVVGGRTASNRSLIEIESMCKHRLNCVQIDLKDIAEVFGRTYKKSLREFISGDTGRDYRRCLLQILGSV